MATVFNNISTILAAILYFSKICFAQNCSKWVYKYEERLKEEIRTNFVKKLQFSISNFNFIINYA